eukprot:TRINITY_DN8282_c0_g1_i2.p1 TRINITY_DN8282_c0_g1~~TRINITY_DN8282_c0_g1_i2.p1  ORF type:complete len:440 (+),score=86.38 TRINITY_DN8282_c0_g1_i2:194-1321(+)
MPVVNPSTYPPNSWHAFAAMQGMAPSDMNNFPASSATNLSSFNTFDYSTPAQASMGNAPAAPFETLSNEWTGLGFNTHVNDRNTVLPTDLGDAPHVGNVPTMGQMLQESISDELAQEANENGVDNGMFDMLDGRSSSRQSSDFFLPDRKPSPSNSGNSSRNGRTGDDGSGSGSDRHRGLHEPYSEDGKSITSRSTNEVSEPASQYRPTPANRPRRGSRSTNRKDGDYTNDFDEQFPDSNSEHSTSSEEYVAPRRSGGSTAKRGSSRRGRKPSAKAAKKALARTDTSGSLPFNKRFPSKSTQVLKRWLFEHTEDPYPSEDVKHELMEQSGLSLAQLNNWFINARRRLLIKKTAGKGGEFHKRASKETKSTSSTKPS